MNIALLTTEYAHEKTPEFGGIGTFFSILAQGLKNKEHNVHVVIFKGKRNYEFNDNGVKVYVRKDFFRKKKIINLIRSITKSKESLFDIYKKCYSLEREYIAKEFYKVIENKNIDVIETQDYKGISAFLNDSIPLVIRCHGTKTVLNNEFGYHNINSYEKVFENFEKEEISNEKNNIIAVSEYCGKLIEKYFNRKTQRVIYNGIDINLFKPHLPSKTIPKSIYYFGTLSEKKGVKFLSEIFNKIYEKDNEVTLHLIGKGRKYFENLKHNVFTKSSFKNVHYYGEMTYGDLNKELAKAAVIVFPTQGENFPFVFLEAMSLEKVIIANSIEPAYEIITIGKNGFIAKGEEDFITQINKVLYAEHNTELIAKEARKTVQEKFTNTMMIEKTIKFYEGIVEKKQY